MSILPSNQSEFSNHSDITLDTQISCPTDNPNKATVILFQSACICFLIAYLVPSGKYCILFMHSILALAHLLVIIWIWKVCFTIPSLLVWCLTFLGVDTARVLYHLYTNRPVKFSKELNDIYKTLFGSINVPRPTFEQLISQGKVMSLHAGEAYAMERLTTTDRLSLLITGKVNVISGNHLLHCINPCEFLDSPEWESGLSHVSHGERSYAQARPIYHTGSSRSNKELDAKKPLINNDNKFNVSLIAATSCRYICWNRDTLEYFLVKDCYLSNVLSLILARDITNKLYAMNDKITSNKGSQLDIRLPVIITSLSKQVCKTDARKAHSANIYFRNTNQASSFDSNDTNSIETERRNSFQIKRPDCSIVMSEWPMHPCSSKPNSMEKASLFQTEMM